MRGTFYAMNTLCHKCYIRHFIASLPSTHYFKYLWGILKKFAANRKSYVSSNPKISVITVVFNNAKDIGYTLESIASQSYENVEHIVIDGKSTDGTLEILTKHKEQIDVLVSEKDRGIYDAMNKGLKRATGEYVLFLNSGDAFYDENTLSDIFSNSEGADIYYGETKLIDENRQIIGDRRHKTPKQFTWKSFGRGMNICHQAIYIKRSIAPQYDLQYKISADIDWVIRSAKKAKTCVNTHIYTTRYLVGGLSKQRHKEGLKERYAILKKHYGFLPNLWNHGIITLRYFFQLITKGKPND